MAKQINCGICAFHGITTAMLLQREGFFQCPECKAQTYDNDEGDDSFIRHYKKQQTEYISRSFQPGTHVTGGTDPTGKAKESCMKKKTTSKLAYELGDKRYF